jgi:hypothetical protein
MSWINIIPRYRINKLFHRIRNMQEQPAKWEWKVLILIIIGILVIIGLIWYSYQLSSRSALTTRTEGFKTYSELVNELNQNRTNLLKISNVQNQALVDIDPDVTKYIQADNIFTTELEQRLNTSFDIQFSQKLQDTELQDLQGQLETLKQKMSKLPPVPSNYMLKNLGGSAFSMLGTPNDFSLRINPNEARCLGFSSYGISNPMNPDSLSPEYKSSTSIQCDAGGGDKTQRFKLTEIKNNQDFNRLVGDTHEVPDYYTLNNYPFMVAQPVNGTLREDGMLNECITFDNSGLSVEACTGAETQRWHTYSMNE